MVSEPAKAYMGRLTSKNGRSTLPMQQFPFRLDGCTHYHWSNGDFAMADETMRIRSTSIRRFSPTVRQIAVLAALAATGTLATDLLLPSLPQMAASLEVSSAAVTSAITVFLAVSRSVSSWSGRSRIATAGAGRC